MKPTLIAAALVFTLATPPVAQADEYDKQAAAEKFAERAHQIDQYNLEQARKRLRDSQSEPVKQAEDESVWWGILKIWAWICTPIAALYALNAIQVYRRQQKLGRHYSSSD